MKKILSSVKISSINDYWRLLKKNIRNYGIYCEFYSIVLYL